jgi:hypothetical protein
MDPKTRPEQRNYRIERRDFEPKTYLVGPENREVTLPSGGVTESISEQKCPDCGRWFEIRGVLGPLFMSLGASCDERHRGKAPIEGDR